ncbi:MAG: hypothetical protein ACD_2C00163G0002 [uncultured bacterium (gcode 4)]|uniref:Uncharacterized protein n=1 Tax=uncultured bacterium (gcode 4) TaxID=1234023 RepID=K2G5C7_9BACT|nr:MAG: hypothetical protein ACD_2C00163G0002 [uncultured bacterium (gcode 4)]
MLSNKDKYMKIIGLRLNYIFENRNDAFKFILYAAFFSYLLFAWQKAYSPIWEVEFNSAWEKYFQTESSRNDEGTFSLGKKSQKKPVLSLELNPDLAKVDETLLKAIKYNVESRIFKEKVTPLDLTIDTTRIDPRWRVTWTKLMLSWQIKDLSESMKVLVHELGHIVDLHFLPNLWDYDPSENFYNISWVSYNVKKKWSKMQDFLSGYALTNKYEDFAESFSFFVFHNEEFRSRSQKNLMIARKYNYFKKYVFIDSEFSNTSFEKLKIAHYNWDTTKIPVNLKKYLYYIR